MARTRLRGISVGGIQIGIEVPEVYEWEWPDSPVSEFQCLPRDPEVNVGVRVDAPDQADLGGERYSVGAWTFEVARLSDGDWVMGLSRRGRREKLARFDREFGAGEIIVSAETAKSRAYPLRCPFDEWIVLHRTVARGGLCLNASASPREGGAILHLGGAPAAPAHRWTVPTPSLLGRSALLVREAREHLRLFRAPWSESIDPRLPFEVRVHALERVTSTEVPWTERLDPADAADLLVTHAIVPLCDEAFLDRVMRNAQRIAQTACVIERGVAEREEPDAPVRELGWTEAGVNLAAARG